MKVRTISPRELAEATGVSESSVKRWVDAGRIPVSRTAGGHRRILMPDAVQFLRGQGMPLVRPELFGLEDLVAASDPLVLTGEAILHAVADGRGAQVRGLIVQSYLAGMAPEELFDGPISDAMRGLGPIGHADVEMIGKEHRITALTIEALNQIRMFQRDPAPDARVAVGGAPEDDLYVLPSLMSSIVLAEQGFEPVNLGPQVPPATLEHAADEYGAGLVWLAVTNPIVPERQSGIRAMCERLISRNCDVVVGGAGSFSGDFIWPDGVRLMRSMRNLATFATSRSGR